MPALCQESESVCICMLGVSILLLFLLISDWRTIQSSVRVWYFLLLILLNKIVDKNMYFLPSGVK